MTENHQPPELFRAGVSVSDFDARGDGKTDDTPAFLTGLFAAKKRRLPLLVPPGRYRLTQTLPIEELTLCGFCPEGGPYPELIIDHTDGPGLHLISGAAVGLCLSFPADGSRRGTALLLSAPGNRVSDLCILRAADGILFSGEGPSNPGRSNVSRVDMQDISHIGVRVTNTYDVSLLQDITVTGLSGSSGTVGFLFGKNDDVRISRCSVRRMERGFSFTDLPAGNDQGETFSTWGSFVDCSAEEVAVGIAVRSHFPALRMAPLIFNDCRFSADRHALDIGRCGANITLAGCTLSSRGSAVWTEGGHELLCTRCLISSEEDDAVCLNDGRHAVFLGNTVRAAKAAIRCAEPLLPGRIWADNRIFEASGSPKEACQ